jgi:uracil-DNA glycosylase
VKRSNRQQESFSFECGANEAPESGALTAWAPKLWEVAADWQPLVDRFFAGPTGEKLGDFVRERLAAGATIFPCQPLRALSLTPLSQVRVVILGQDPYHGPGQAQGLAFSVSSGLRLPPSLRNIFKEVRRDPALGPPSPVFPVDGSLVSWANQGVLLLNTCLTVEAGHPASHAQQGWEALTRAAIQAVAVQSEPVVFMLWGAHAQVMQQHIEVMGPSEHLILTANHPSPLSALRPPKPFLGCGHFSMANSYLLQKKRRPVVWQAN